VRDGGPAEVRHAIDWYRGNGRLHSFDPVAIVTDALTGYRTDIVAGRDALLVCSTTEMADALNRRLHRDTARAQTSTVAAARGHHIGVGVLILDP
jgi:hypothetical protein